MPEHHKESNGLKKILIQILIGVALTLFGFGVNSVFVAGVQAQKIKACEDGLVENTQMHKDTAKQLGALEVQVGKLETTASTLTEAVKELTKELKKKS
jgi:peptidoglycan hydrolase CwlO-like protein